METLLISLKNRILDTSCSSSIAFVMLLLFFFVPMAMAESWYIKPSKDVPLRRGQGTDYKILSIVPDGTRVNIIEENAPWAKVVSEEGKKGWILKRFLTQSKPLSEVVDLLLQENNTLKEEQAALIMKTDETGNQNTKLQQDLDTCIGDLTQTREQYQTLMQDTADVMLIKKNLALSKQTISTLQQELKVISTENIQLRTNQNIKWYLAGGGTLIFGCIVGMISSRSRKRKPSLY